eukprot:366345-Chlamydomonas_euryale.AAC.3
MGAPGWRGTRAQNSCQTHSASALTPRPRPRPTFATPSHPTPPHTALHSTNHVCSHPRGSCWPAASAPRRLCPVGSWPSPAEPVPCSGGRGSGGVRCVAQKVRHRPAVHRRRWANDDSKQHS